MTMTEDRTEPATEPATRTETVVTVPASVLVAAVTRASKATASNRTALTGLTNILFTVDDIGTFVTGTDLDAWLNVLLADADVTGPAVNRLVPAARLTKWLAALPKAKRGGEDAPVRIAFTVDGETTFTAGTRSATFKAEDMDLYPVSDGWQTYGASDPFELNAGDLASVLPAASTDDTRPALCTVAIDAGWIVATNGFVLAGVDSGLGDVTGETFLLPAAKVGLFLAGKERTDDGGVMVEVSADRRLAKVYAGYETMTVRLADDNFPSWRNFRRGLAEGAGRLVVNVDETVREVANLAKLASDMPVRFANVDGVTVEFSIRDSVNGADYRATMPGTWADNDGEPWAGDTIAVNPKFFKTFLTGMGNGEGVATIGVVDRLKPLTVETVDATTGREQFRVVMPVKVD
jgi:DNA polymerase III sliding clamp (beta) subunit (PCNA family)